MSELVNGIGLATVASAVGAIAACIKGISQKYSGPTKSSVWTLGFSVGLLEGIFDSWALQIVSSNINLSCKGFGVLFSAIMGFLFAGERPQTIQYVASFFLVTGPLLIAYASMAEPQAGIWCPIDASPDTTIAVADILVKSVYAIAAALLLAGEVFKIGQTGGVADFRVLGWMLWASILHTLQANRIHDFNWDPLQDFITHDNFSSFGVPTLDRLQVSLGILTATILFQTAETMAFKNAGSVGPVHAAYIGTLILDAVLHDMGHGVFASYSCTQYWILAIGAGFCFVGAAFAATIKHGHGDEHVEDKSKGKEKGNKEGKQHGKKQSKKKSKKTD
jgi:hypothetical protein